MDRGKPAVGTASHQSGNKSPVGGNIPYIGQRLPPLGGEPDRHNSKRPVAPKFRGIMPLFNEDILGFPDV